MQNRRSRFTSYARLLGPALIVAIVTLIGGGTASASSCTTGRDTYLPTGQPWYWVEAASFYGNSACITVGDTGANFHIDSTNISPELAADQKVNGFYSTYTGCKSACLELNYEVPIARLNSAMTTWLFTTTHVSGKFDATYDMTFNKTTIYPLKAPTGGEVMIWLNHKNANLGGPELPDLTIGGELYHVFKAWKTTPEGSWWRIAFERANPRDNVRGLDLAPFIRAAVADGALYSSWYWQDTQAGFEVWYGGAGLESWGFSAPTPTLYPK